MSKQTTLFSTWGGNSTNVDSEANIAPAGKDLDISDEDHDLEDDLQLTEQELQQLCDLEPSFSSSVPPDSKQLHTSSFHIGPSHSFLNSSIIEEEIPGFDNEAGQLWIYPTNYSPRDYQYNIVHKALFTNTLVCLPTGLGKTFIAAVVMYNFYRWYPSGKIVFLAPTKPLVTQQIEACHNVMGIPQDHSAEMTGQMPPKVRISIWQTKRVFFLTPQVMQNDLQKSTCPAQDVCCVVFDEAHKALGNHAYCQVVKELSSCKARFRVLALSATPGNDLKAVQQVVSNLQIGTIEIRSEESIDIQRYSHERTVEKLVVSLDGEIMDIKSSFASVLTGVLNRLIRYNVLYQCTPDRLSKFQLLQARDKFRVTGSSSGVLPGAVEGDFASAISLFHAYELLLLHGMKSFYQFLTNTFSAGSQHYKAKAEILKNPQFRHIVKRLKERVDSSERSQFITDKPTLLFPRTSGMPSKTEDATENDKNSFFYSHPKLRKLEDIVLRHFRDFQDDQLSDGIVKTRVMIFSQYRDSVREITEMLNRHSPMVRVMSFVGHSTGKSNSRGLTQKEQTEIVSNFREGGYNTLVATCVGEEGLDIGDVDLIVCFDAPKSPIRLVQRMGRTGRKRKGRIVMIVAEGKEEQVYNKSQSNKKSIHRAINNGCKTLTYYQHCHRMVPKHIHPQVHKMHMVVDEFVRSRKPKKESSVPHLQTATSVQPKIKFGNGGKKVKRGTYLNEQELSCWSDGLSLTDREFKTLRKSVTNCFSQEPLLCLPSLNGCLNRSCDGPDTSVLSRSINSTSLNSSVGRINAVFSLNLNRWINYQTSTIPLNIVGSSTRTEHFLSTLEFIDILRTSEDMGSSYDLEMETYLDQKDIKLSQKEKKQDILERKDTCRTENTIMNDATPLIKDTPNRKERKRPNAKANCRKKRFFDFESSDEDFVTSEKVSEKSNSKKLIPSPVKLWKSSAADSPHDQEPNPVDNLQRSPSSTDNLDLSSLTQHVIPRAPSEDALDWLDELRPSQISTPHLVTSLTLSPDLSPVVSSSECRQGNKRDLERFSEPGGGQFVTPKAPSFSLRSKHKPLYKYSTPTVASVSCAKVNPANETSVVMDGLGSIDLFEDVSAGALFADFSQSHVEVGSSTSKKSPNLPKCCKSSVIGSDPCTRTGTVNSNPCTLTGAISSNPCTLTGTVNSNPCTRTGTVNSNPCTLTGTVNSNPCTRTGTVSSNPCTLTGTVSSNPCTRTGTVNSNPCTLTGTVSSNPCTRTGTVNSNPCTLTGAISSNPCTLAGAVTEPGTEQTDVYILCDSDDNEMDPVVIEESDLELDDKDWCDGDDRVSDLRTTQHKASHNEAKTTFQHNHESLNEDSFLSVQKKCRKRSRKRRNEFLESPTSPYSGQVYDISKDSLKAKEDRPPAHTPRKVSTAPSVKFISSRKKNVKVMFEEDTSDDEFCMPLSKRIARSGHGNTQTTVGSRRLISSFSALPKTGRSKKKQVNELFEQEAERSSDDGSLAVDSSQSDLDEYDCSDSFINDNSMLTQISPSQRFVKTSKVSKAQSNSHDLYLKSLLSPADHLFGGKRRGCGTRYRMVFSQRHKLLNHYIDKAGFKVADEGRSNHRKATTRNRSLDDQDPFEMDSSPSEAEEVNVPYGEEEELSQSIRPESNLSLSSLQESSVGHVNHNVSSVLEEHSPSEKQTFPLPEVSVRDKYRSERFLESGSSVSKVRNTGLPLLSDTADGLGTVIISLSLLDSIKIHPTPACFSLGMDEWIES